MTEVNPDYSDIVGPEQMLNYYERRLASLGTEIDAIRKRLMEAVAAGSSLDREANEYLDQIVSKRLVYQSIMEEYDVGMAYVQKMAELAEAAKNAPQN